MNERLTLEFQVKRTLFQAANLFVSCSKSGKMGKHHLDEFVEQVYVPLAAEKSALIVDKWSTFTEENILRKVPAEKEVSPYGPFYLKKSTLF